MVTRESDLHGPDHPLLVQLDPDERISARLWLQDMAGSGVRVAVALHDPGRADAAGEDEVYALLLPPDRAWELGAALTRLAQATR